jgi:hypothetical protein
MVVCQVAKDATRTEMSSRISTKLTKPAMQPTSNARKLGSACHCTTPWQYSSLRCSFAKLGSVASAQRTPAARNSAPGRRLTFWLTGGSRKAAHLEVATGPCARHMHPHKALMCGLGASPRLASSEWGVLQAAAQTSCLLQQGSPGRPEQHTAPEGRSAPESKPLGCQPRGLGSAGELPAFDVKQIL